MEYIWFACGQAAVTVSRHKLHELVLCLCYKILWKIQEKKTEIDERSNHALVMQRYIVQTIYRVDIGHIVSYQYRQEKYRNFDISLSFRYRYNIGKTTSMLSIYFFFCR